MGEVYRARDTKLGREVALKLLPPLFTADADRVARFEREARLLASLNHPHIGAIYGFEDAGHVPALVLELVEGDTLEDRVRRGPLPLSEALAVAQQIADALEAAHRAGILHRDLKPANIKITPDWGGQGARLRPRQSLRGRRPGADLSQSPTMTTSGTIAGVILGTAAYMSPEQARGQPVDKRTDIWAFGCVLFEMLTGSSAFARETATDTIARRCRRRARMEVASGQYAGQHPTFACPLSPERCQAAASRHRGRSDRDRRHDGHACRSGSSADGATAVPPGILGAVACHCDSPRLLVGGARQVREARGGTIAAGYSRDTSHGSSRPRGVSGHFTRRQVGGVHRRRGRQTAGLRAAHCRRRAAANHARYSRSRVPSLVARLELDPVFFAGGIRSRPGEHLGDPSAWRRATAGRRQRGRC